MVLLLYSLFFFGELTSETRLENAGMYLSQVDYNRLRLFEDGSVIAMTKYHVWHWNQDGSLRNRFGGKGEGPGEFSFVGEVHWDGEFYWVIDGRRLVSSVFDHQGRFLFSQALFVRQFVPINNRLFAVDISEYNPFQKNYPPVLRELDYSIHGEQIVLGNQGLRFRKVTERQAELRFNFKLIWAVRQNDTYYVMDQISNRIWVYSPPALAAEAAVGPDKPFEPDYLELPLRGYVPPPEQFEPKRSRIESLIWWKSWSRINFFGRAGEDFVVGYEMPNPENPKESLQAIQRVAVDGRLLGPELLTEGILVGVMDDQAWIFEEEEDEGFDYFIRRYRF